MLAMIIAVALLLRGAYVELALAANLGHVRRSAGPLETRSSLMLWNPWFMIGGTCSLVLTVVVPPPTAPTRSSAPRPRVALTPRTAPS
jgi:hypothetical protein